VCSARNFWPQGRAAPGGRGPGGRRPPWVVALGLASAATSGIGPPGSLLASASAASSTVGASVKEPDAAGLPVFPGGGPPIPRPRRRSPVGRSQTPGIAHSQRGCSGVRSANGFKGQRAGGTRVGQGQSASLEIERTRRLSEAFERSGIGPLSSPLGSVACYLPLGSTSRPGAGGVGPRADPDHAHRLAGGGARSGAAEVVAYPGGATGRATDMGRGDRGRPWVDAAAGPCCRCCSRWLAADAPRRLALAGAAADRGWRRRWPPAGGWCCSVRGMCRVCQRLLCRWPWRSVTQLSAAAASRASPRLAAARRRPLPLPCSKQGGCWCVNHTGSARGPLEALLDQLQDHRRSSAPICVCCSQLGRRLVLGEAAAGRRSCLAGAS